MHPDRAPLELGQRTSRPRGRHDRDNPSSGLTMTLAGKLITSWSQSRDWQPRPHGRVRLWPSAGVDMGADGLSIDVKCLTENHQRRLLVVAVNRQPERCIGRHSQLIRLKSVPLDCRVASNPAIHLPVRNRAATKCNRQAEQYKMPKGIDFHRAIYRLTVACWGGCSFLVVWLSARPAVQL